VKTTYAAGTTVSVEKSKGELDGLLGKHGASSRGIVVDDDRGLALVAFQLNGLRYRMEVPMPKPEEFLKPKSTPRDWWRMGGQQRAEWARRSWDQAMRERWRAVVLLVKAKLELVRIGISTVEKEFMADLILPNGETVNVAIAKQLQAALASGTMPMLPMGES
jgi:hypothetical protein